MAPVSPRAEPVNTEALVTPLFQHIPRRDVAPTTPIVKTPTVENLSASHTSFSAPAAHPLSHSATQPVSNSVSHTSLPSHTFHHQNDDESSSDDFSCVETGDEGHPGDKHQGHQTHMPRLTIIFSFSPHLCDFNSQEKATGQHLMSIKFAR